MIVEEEVIVDNNQPDIEEEVVGEVEPGDVVGHDDDDQDEEVVVTLGDEPSDAEVEAEREAERAPQWVKDLRKDHRAAQRKIRELEQQVAAAKAPAQKAKIEVGPKPNLADDDIDYDQDKYDAKLTAWLDRKRQADQEVKDQEAAQQEADKAWRSQLDDYHTKKAALKLPDFDDAESAVTSTMNVTQQGIIVSGADNPALVIYALGRNDAKVKELAAIKDPVKFAFAIAKLETQIKMQKKSKPAPERTITGSAPRAGAVDSSLDRLRAEAEKTGDYSKVIAYKRQKAKA